MIKDLTAYIEGNGETFWDESGRKMDEEINSTYSTGEKEEFQPYSDKLKLDLYNAKFEGRVLLDIDKDIIVD